MERARMSKEQVKNMYYIIGRAKDAGFSADDARMASWIAFAESSLGETSRGNGTISGMYQYSKGAWENRSDLYRYDETEPNENKQFKDFTWNTNKDQISAQVTVFLADLDRYKKEFGSLSEGEEFETVYKKDPQGMKAWGRFMDPANDIPFTFEDYAYLRHNTSVGETKRVNANRTSDRDGVYEAIRNFTDLVYDPGYEPGIHNSALNDGSDLVTGLPGHDALWQELFDIGDDEDQHCAPGPSPGM